MPPIVRSCASQLVKGRVGTHSSVLTSTGSGGGGGRAKFDVVHQSNLLARRQRHSGPVTRWATYRTNHQFIRSSHSEAASSVKSTTLAPRSFKWIAIGLGGATLVTAFNLTTQRPVQSQEHAQHMFDPSDPLSALNPHSLHSSTNHLRQSSLSSLVRQYFVYLGSGLPGVVQAGPWILNKFEWTRDNVPIIGPVVWSLFSATIESTFYSVFVGGPTVPECAPVINMLADHGIGCLLNYGAEAKVDGSAKLTGVNDAHMIEAVNAVRHCSKFVSQPISTVNENQLKQVQTNTTSELKPTLLAIKLTGMIWDPSLLKRATLALENSTSYARGERLSRDVLFPDSPDLTTEDKQELNKLYQGLRDVAREAKKGGVRLLIDAEQSWFQPAIDRMVDLLSEEFNKSSNDSTPSVPIIYNTYQTYLRTTPPKMKAALQHADENGYSFGAKLVRGAYVEAERAKWERDGERGDCIVWNNKQETDDCFDNCAKLLEQRIVDEIQRENNGQVKTTTAAFYASHNGTSMRKVLESLKKDGLARVNDQGLLELNDNLRGRISFGQLYGMSDNLTTALVGLIAPPSQNATSTLPVVNKYLPYATIEQALPYLIRRANENQSILSSDPTSGRGGAADERRAVGREIRRRCGIPF
ncbi:proline dehydrogenase [Microbotryomycetes sp. JL221]|nr:proline dehydrogenase [Microbotryomycetes sp. JL221]